MLYIWFYGEKNFINFFLVLTMVGTSIDLKGGGAWPSSPGPRWRNLFFSFAYKCASPHRGALLTAKFILAPQVSVTDPVPECVIVS